MTRNVYTVGQVNAYIKNMFTQDYMLNRIYVKGEVSNCKYHTSGHIYFSLKDESGTIACVMFAGQRGGLSFRMCEGQQIVVFGQVNVYERGGSYQLYAREIRLDGEGVLYERFQALKRELEEMGMFASAAFGVTDETFAVYTTTANAPRTPRYFFSMALCSYLSWALGSWLGAIATGLLPPLITAALGISLYAMFIGLLMPGLHGNGRLAALVVLTALCNTVLCNVVQLDSGWSMILSTLGCAALGSFFVTPNAAGEENSHAEP